MADVPPPGVLDWDFPRSVASIALLTAYAREHGIPEESMLQDTGLDRRDLDDVDRQVDARVELAVIRNLLRELGDRPGLGLDVGRRYRVTTFGIFGFACIASPTLRDAIGIALRYLELSFTFCIPVVEVGADEIVARLHDERVPDDVRQFALERDLAAMYSMLADIRGSGLPLQRIEFRDRAPSYADEYRKLFGVTPVFERPDNLFTFDPDELNQPLPQANTHAMTICQAQCRDLVARRRARVGIAHDVREKLISVVGETAGIDEVARELNMSTRTLRRRLTESGTSYRALLDEVRVALAEELLSSTHLSVSDIAIRLGYAEASTFIHAFKRWKGITPTAYRGPVRR